MNNASLHYRIAANAHLAKVRAEHPDETKWVPTLRWLGQACAEAQYWWERNRDHVGQLDEQRTLLRLLAKQLRFYEQQHLAKGTQEGRDKAAVNAELAAMCEETIAKAPVPERQAVPNVGENTSRPQNIQEDVGAPSPSGVTP